MDVPRTANCHGPRRDIQTTTDARSTVTVQVRQSTASATPNLQERAALELGAGRDALVQLDAMAIRLIRPDELQRLSPEQGLVAVVHERPVGVFVAAQILVEQSEEALLQPRKCF